MDAFEAQFGSTGDNTGEAWATKAYWFNRPLSLKSAADRSPYHGKGFIYLVTPKYVYFLVSSFNGENIPVKLHVTPHLFVIDDIEG